MRVCASNDACRAVWGVGSQAGAALVNEGERSEPPDQVRRVAPSRLAAFGGKGSLALVGSVLGLAVARPAAPPECRLRASARPSSPCSLRGGQPWGPSARLIAIRGGVADLTYSHVGQQELPSLRPSAFSPRRGEAPQDITRGSGATFTSRSKREGPARARRPSREEGKALCASS